MNEEQRRKQFFRMYLAAERSISRFVRLLVHDRDLLEDVCQAVALRLWERFDSYNSDRRFDAWALGVTVNVVSELRRSHARFSRVVNPGVAAALMEAYCRDSTQGIEFSDQMDALRTCLGDLPEQYRELIHLRYYDSAPIEEISLRTGRTTAATYKAIERSVERLATCVRRRLAPQTAATSYPKATDAQP